MSKVTLAPARSGAPRPCPNWRSLAFISDLAIPFPLRITHFAPTAAPSHEPDSTPSLHSIRRYHGLTFSASKGNGLSSLFPRQGPSSPWENENQVEGAKGACYWCLCASRWWEAVKASKDHPEGDKIVPKVVLGSTHAKWVAGVRGVDEHVKRNMLEKHALKR